MVPRLSWITGDLDVHDVSFGANGRPLLVNTAFGCLATEDRCHLNGLATEAGVPRDVTAVSTSDVADGWRDRRADGGVVIDVQSNEIVCTGLSMPHSPRLHDGRLWVLNSGAGEFGWVDLAARRYVPVAFCPGYARGLSFVGSTASIGLSLARENRTFRGLPLDAALSAKGAEASCGLIAVDTASGDTVAWARVEGVIQDTLRRRLHPGQTAANRTGVQDRRDPARDLDRRGLRPPRCLGVAASPPGRHGDLFANARRP